MKRLIAAALFAAGLTFVPTPAHAATTPCTSSELVESEWHQLAPGQSLAQVTSIIGGSGMFLAAESTSTKYVYRWTFCSPWGRWDQRLPFAKDGGTLRLTEVTWPGR